MRRSSLLASLLFLASVAGACGPEPDSGGPDAPSATATTAPYGEEDAFFEPFVGALPGDLIPEFTATVQWPSESGVRNEAFASRATARATVYIVNSATCPSCDGYAERMKAIETTYAPRGVDVVHVYPNQGESDADKIAWHAERGFAGGQILDSDSSIARKLEAERTPTVCFVGADGLVVYRGAIDDTPSGEGVKSPYLANALDAHLEGREVELSSTEPSG